MNKRPMISILAPAAALAWCIVVIAAYYVFNHSYYVDKIRVFGRFLVDLTS